jgi:hypothetical protein
VRGLKSNNEKKNEFDVLQFACAKETSLVIQLLMDKKMVDKRMYP